MDRNPPGLNEGQSCTNFMQGPGRVPFDLRGRSSLVVVNDAYFFVTKRLDDRFESSGAVVVEGNSSLS
jgi:hypothetical protein